MKKKTRELISDLKASGFRYMPIYGGYKGDDDVVDNYEPSFIVSGRENSPIFSG